MKLTVTMSVFRATIAAVWMLLCVSDRATAQVAPAGNAAAQARQRSMRLTIPTRLADAPGL